MTASDWGARCEPFLRERMTADAAHDLAHVRRVVAWAERIGRAEGADLDVVLPAAWLHDCVVLPKDSPNRKKASFLAADVAAEALRQWGEAEGRIEAVAHAVEAHSFSAGVEPRTMEAKAVQDADRLDALGALGIARCFATAGAMGAALFHPEDPVPSGARPLDDRSYAVDHFFAKLFRLPETLHTATARAEADRRVRFMRGFLNQLAAEVGTGTRN